MIRLVRSLAAENLQLLKPAWSQDAWQLVIAEFYVGVFNGEQSYR
jgi:hypothetical protein